MSSALYPNNLSFLTKRIKNFKRQTRILNPLSLTSATSQATIEVQFPANSLVDLSTFAMYFQGSIAVTGANAGAQFPKNFESLLYRIQVESNGTILENGCNYYNQLVNSLCDLTVGKPCEDKRSILFSNPIAAVPTTATTPTAQNPQNMAINNWWGFISSVSPNVIDTGIMPLKIRLTLASDDILARNATCTAATYTLSNIYFSYDQIQIDDGIFYGIYLDGLNKGVSVQYNYKQWWNYSSSTTSGSQTTNFSLSTQSLNRVISFFVSPSAVRIQNPGANPPAAGANPYWDSITDNSSYFTRFYNGTINVDTGAAIVAVNPGIQSYQYNIQGDFYPNFLIKNPIHAYALLLNAVNMSQDVLHGISSIIGATTNPQASFMSNFGMTAVQLEHGDPTFISGIDSRGSMMANSWITNGGAIGMTLLSLIFCETSSSVVVGQGFQLVPIY